MKYNWLFKTGCISMAIMLGLGARYGHVGALEPAGVIMFNKAQTYHIVNSNSSHNLAVGLFAASMVNYSKPSIPFKVALLGFLLGFVCFVGPLYYTAIAGKHQVLSKLMPVGGLSMIAGWINLIFA